MPKRVISSLSRLQHDRSQLNRKINSGLSFMIKKKRRRREINNKAKVLPSPSKDLKMRKSPFNSQKNLRCKKLTIYKRSWETINSILKG